VKCPNCKLCPTHTPMQPPPVTERKDIHPFDMHGILGDIDTDMRTVWMHADGDVQIGGTKYYQTVNVGPVTPHGVKMLLEMNKAVGPPR
jgi:hypothetical protein